MRIAQINMTHLGSTGRIMFHIADNARKAGHEARTYSPNIFSRVKKIVPLSSHNHFTWGGVRESAFHYYVGSFFGLNGLLSRKGTRQLLGWLDEFKPDVIHLHNLHSYCVNLPMLFGYIKKNNIKTVWTLHDCWSFTGHCPHFVMSKCDKWKYGCHHCPSYRAYPKSYFDDSRRMYESKRKWFTGVGNMTLVTPSKWLADLTRQSFLQDYPVTIIHNGIDLAVFKPTESDFKIRHGCEDQTIVLGVAFDWSERKGLDVFNELADRLDDGYRVVLVGTDAQIDDRLSKKIISVHHTESQCELAKIYTSADVFVNPTREDTFPTVNMESLACGTPVITFRTGGSAEIIDQNCGAVVDVNDIDTLEKEIRRVKQGNPYSAEACIKRAKQFDMNDKYKEYVDLYERL